MSLASLPVVRVGSSDLRPLLWERVTLGLVRFFSAPRLTQCQSRLLSPAVALGACFAAESILTLSAISISPFFCGSRYNYSCFLFWRSYFFVFDTVLCGHYIIGCFITLVTLSVSLSLCLCLCLCLSFSVCVSLSLSLSLSKQFCISLIGKIRQFHFY